MDKVDATSSRVARLIPNQDVYEGAEKVPGPIMEALKKTFELYKELAERLGSISAQYELGRCYKFGLGVGKDEDLAFFWMQKTANQGNMFAQASLGFDYSLGTGVKQDMRKAVFWLQKAGAQGHLLALEHLENEKFQNYFNEVKNNSYKDG